MSQIKRHVTKLDWTYTGRGRWSKIGLFKKNFHLDHNPDGSGSFIFSFGDTQLDISDATSLDKAKEAVDNYIADEIQEFLRKGKRPL